MMSRGAMAGMVMVAVAACGDGSEPEAVTDEALITPLVEETAVEISDPPDASTTPAAPTTETTPTTAEPSTTGTQTTVAAGTALQSCGDVPFITTDVIGDDPNGVDGDPLFDAVLYRYAMEHQLTFGGMWLAREAGGTTVLAFTDDPETHRTAIAELRPTEEDLYVFAEPLPDVDLERSIGEWGKAFDVVQVTYTEAEIVAFATDVGTALDRSGMTMPLSGDIRRGMVSLQPGRAVTFEQVAAIADVIAPAVPLEVVCLDGEAVETLPEPVAQPGDALDVVVLPDAEGTYPPDTEVACGSARFTLDELRSLTPLVEFDPTLQTVIDDVAIAIALGDVYTEGWTVLRSDDELVTLAWIGEGPSPEIGDDDGLLVIGVERGVNGWQWIPGTGGGPCQVLTIPLPTGLGEVEWMIDPAFPTPDATSAEVHVLVNERACASGSEIGDRLLGPQVVETDEAVRIVFAAIPPDGEQVCPSNPSTAVTITLERPLGNRALLDGLVVGRVDDLIAAEPGG